MDIARVIALARREGSVRIGEETHRLLEPSILQVALVVGEYQQLPDDQKDALLRLRDLSPILADEKGVRVCMEAVRILLPEFHDTPDLDDIIDNPEEILSEAMRLFYEPSFFEAKDGPPAAPEKAGEEDRIDLRIAHIAMKFGVLPDEFIRKVTVRQLLGHMVGASQLGFADIAKMIGFGKEKKDKPENLQVSLAALMKSGVISKAQPMPKRKPQ